MFSTPTYFHSIQTRDFFKICNFIFFSLIFYRTKHTLGFIWFDKLKEKRKEKCIFRKLECLAYEKKVFMDGPH